MKDIIIKTESLSKIYHIYHSNKDRIIKTIFNNASNDEVFYAVKNVNIEIYKGDSVCIIGKNGSGKSTLLKLIAGIMAPSSGFISVNGRICALIELGAGFDPEISGIDNAIYSGMMMGFTKEQMLNRLDEILSFADIGAYADQPVKMYSSGMFVRLAFAVSVSMLPDILIVDEALSVGDVFFQQKCYKKIIQLINDGVTLMLVSHDYSACRMVCNTAYIMEDGEILNNGPTAVMVSYFLASNKMTYDDNSFFRLSRDRSRNNDTRQLSCSEDCFRHGMREIEIISVIVTDKSDKNTFLVDVYEPLFFDVTIKSCKENVVPAIGIHIYDKLSNLIFASGTIRSKQILPKMKNGDMLSVRLTIYFSIQPGEYTFSIGVSEIIQDKSSEVILQDRIESLGPIIVLKPSYALPFHGITCLKFKTELLQYNLNP